MCSFLALALLALQLAPHASPSPLAPAGGSRIRVETEPGMVRTGDAFRLVLRWTPRPGLRLDPPDTLTGLEGVRAMGPVRMGVEEDVPGGERRIQRMVYPFQALAPGSLLLPDLLVRREVDPGKEGAGWARIPLGEIRITPHLPPGEDPHPAAPAMGWEGKGQGRHPSWARRGVLVGVALILLGGVAGRRRRGRPSSPSRIPLPASAAPPGALRRRLARAVSRELSRDPGLPLVWEEPLLFFRRLLGEGGGRRSGLTTTELLEALASAEERVTRRGEPEREGGGEGGKWGRDPASPGALTRSILMEGDRMRFGGEAVSPARARDLLVWIRRWLEVTGA